MKRCNSNGLRTIISIIYITIMHLFLSIPLIYIHKYNIVYTTKVKRNTNNTFMSIPLSITHTKLVPTVQSHQERLFYCKYYIIAPNNLAEDLEVSSQFLYTICLCRNNPFWPTQVRENLRVHLSVVVIEHMNITGVQYE